MQPGADVGTLPPNRQYSIEFRDRSWLIDEVYELLQRYNIALCIYHMEQWVTPKVITADFIYVRLHGPEAKYEGSYDAQTLSGWAGAFSTWAAQGKLVYCYFDNDEQGFAALDALRLKEMLKNAGT